MALLFVRSSLSYPHPSIHSLPPVNRLEWIIGEEDKREACPPPLFVRECP